jgi:pimeloyl-ACP methyl ester carboxylesterase
MKKLLIGFGCVVVSLYLLATALLFVFEAKLIFLPPNFPPATTPAVANLPFEDLHIPVDATMQLHAWWIPAAAPMQKTILFFHGNGYSLESEANLEAPMWHETGANVLAVDYRGFGSSSKMQTDGPSTEADARAALRYLTEQRYVARADIWIGGRSIGTGVATQLAAETPHAGGLILISPISSVKTWRISCGSTAIFFGRRNGSDTKTISIARRKSRRCRCRCSSSAERRTSWRRRRWRSGCTIARIRPRPFIFLRARGTTTFWK